MLGTVMEVAAKQLLMAGVTSAVDLGAPLKESLAVRDRINRGEIPGPRMSMSGPWITRQGGGMTDQFGGIAVTSTAQAAAEVEKLAKAGVDVIKAHSGLTRDDYQAIADTAHKHGIRCVRVVHGKGLGSPGKSPVLKNKVHSWLVQKKEVLAFVQAKPADGGAGALVVLLQPS